MKRLTIILSALVLVAVLFPFRGYSVKHTILVGNFYFNPSSLPDVTLGDTIRWQWVQGTHTTTSTTIPGGAASWDEPISSSNTSYEYKPTVEGTYNYVCTPHASMGQVGSFTVTAAPLTADASADPQLICLGQSSTLNALASGGSGSYAYSWVSDPPGFTSGQATVMVTPAQTTTYTVTVTSGGESASASVTVTVQLPASANAGVDTSYCDNVTSFPVNGTAANYSSVSWTTSGDGTFSSGSTLSDTYNPGPNDLSSGWADLTLTVTSQAPCTGNAADILHILFDPCTGIGRQEKQDITLAVYPNPSTGQFTLQTGTLPETAGMKIFDMQGRVVYSGSIPSSATGSSNAVNLSGLPGGIYQVNVVSGKMTGTARLLIR